MQRFVTTIAFLVGIGVAMAWVVTTPKTIVASTLEPRMPDLANGREMFFAGGCAACHATPGEEDRTKLGGGLGLKSPFGTFYVPNISPDPNDGIGSWSEVDFVTAVLRGTSPQGQHYYPAFPYVSYQRMRLDDVRDLHAFMKTLPAVKGRVRDHDVPFPFNIRRAVGGWKFLFMGDKPFTADASKSDEWNRGAYLVNGPSHCAECHSPRNFLGGIIQLQRFAGGPDYESGGWVPNITQKALGDYSEDDIAYLLETGQTLKDTVGGGMVAVIRNTSQLTDADRKAMAVYLKSLPPVEGPPRPPRN